MKIVKLVLRRCSRLSGLINRLNDFIEQRQQIFRLGKAALTVKSRPLFANYSSADLAASGKVHLVNTIYKTTVTVAGIDQVMRNRNLLLG